VPLKRASSYHPSDADLSVTRIVHGSLILEMRGTRVLVDPWFHSGLVVRQREPLGLVPDGLPELAAVLLTHRHGDHFDRRALHQIAPTVPEVLAPPELHARLVDLGFRQVTDLRWWDRAQVGGMTVTAVPARHAVRENGYVVESGGVTAYVAGDTRFFPELVDVATRFPDLDTALLPIGGLRLLGFPREMGPEDAARAAALLRAKRVIPIAYGARGSFPLHWYAGQPVERFVAACERQGVERGRVVVLEPGESWHYFK
jgi:L-ascorbate metabolism protein UlaG (beta-lactamase superfamily)